MYINIHAHQHEPDPEVITVYNLFPGEHVLNTKDLFSAGLHPWYIKNDNKATLKRIEDLLHDKQVVAIGECGIDRIKGPSPGLQEEIFEQHANLAEKFGKPLIIHCVKAYDRILYHRKKRSNEIPWIIHGFNGSPQDAQQLIHMNCYLSFGDRAFRKTSKIRQFINNIPLERIFLETDDNNISVKETYQEISELRTEQKDEILSGIYSNFIALFETRC